MSITLPVSIGEAIDKLSILDIKCSFIKDSRRDECQKEYDALLPMLKQHIDKFPFQYRMLKTINEDIWTMQDAFRECSNVKTCIDIIQKNDMRFRIKNNLNVLTSSVLKEQKGYTPKSAVFIGHLGIGDHMGLIGAVRYISLDWDTLYVVCKAKYFKNIQRMYDDTPNIQCVPVQNDYHYPELNNLSYSKVFKSGIFHDVHREFTNLPNQFYEDLGLDPEIQHKYFWISPPKFSLELPVPYIFVHQSASNTTIPLITWDINERLTIDPNTNLYPEGHPWYNIANTCVDMLVADYTTIIINASEVHVLDSSFYCLARYLPLTARVKVCYNRETGKPSEAYTFKENITGSRLVIRKASKTTRSQSCRDCLENLDRHEEMVSHSNP